MRRLSLSISIVFISLTTLLAFQNCSEPNLALNQSHIQAFSSSDFCTSPSDSIKSNIKFIFIVDRSNSNQQDYKVINGVLTPVPTGGTDENGDRRFTALENFIPNFKGGEDEYTFWSMVRFNTTSRVMRGFTNDRNSFNSFIIDQHTRTPTLDAGYTNYLSALNSAYDMIQNDITASKAADPKISSSYVMFFVSDGAPVVGVNNANQPIRQTDEDLKNAVERFYALQDQNPEFVEGMQLNTAYYYDDLTDPSAIDTLQKMADTGNGSFIEFRNGENIDFTRFAIPLRVSRFDLKEFWVTNANTVWEGNDLRADRDSDGISDVLEMELGSNPDLYDTDANGVGDGVEYRISGQSRVCQYEDCRFVGTPYNTCSAHYDASLPNFFGDADNDFLNDCEETLLRSDRNNPDTNFDYIPDHMAFTYDINMIGKANVHLDPDADGLSDYQELKQNTPNRIHNDQIRGVRKMQVHTEIVSEGISQDCYKIYAEDISYVKPTDTIRMYIMENTKALSENRIMRTAEKKLNGGGISFSPDDFK